jgi:hypothetical protein
MEKFADRFEKVLAPLALIQRDGGGGVSKGVGGSREHWIQSFRDLLKGWLIMREQPSSPLWGGVGGGGVGARAS